MRNNALNVPSVKDSNDSNFIITFTIIQSDHYLGQVQSLSSLCIKDYNIWFDK